MIKTSYFKRLVLSAVFGLIFLKIQAQDNYFRRVWVDQANENKGDNYVGWGMPPTGLHFGNGTSGNSGTSIQSNRLIDNNNRFGIDFYTGAVKRVSITSTGNVGIGVVNPNAQLQLSNTVANRRIVLWEVANNNFEYHGFGVNANMLRYNVHQGASHAFYAATSATTASELMRIQSNGNVGIGTSTPNAPLQFANTVVNRKIVLFEVVNNDFEYHGFGVNANTLRYNVHQGGNHIFYAATSANAASELMRIQSNGNVGIGTSGTAGAKLDLVGNLLIRGNTTLPASTTTLLGLSAGYIANNTANYSWIQSPDAKPLALNPLQNTDATKNTYVAIGFVPGMLNVPNEYKLAVNGKIICTELKVQYSGSWSDYVFEKGYQLKKLEEVEKYIQDNKHLPDVPSAEEISKNGIQSGQMDATLLRKIEELTLYMIDQKKELGVLKEENKNLRAEIKSITCK